jgi:hypothetical protein
MRSAGARGQCPSGQRDRGADRRAGCAIRAVPDQLIAERAAADRPPPCSRQQGCCCDCPATGKCARPPPTSAACPEAAPAQADGAE